MKGVVLAAGKGTRLQPLTENKPKGMVNVNGKPLLSHCYDQLIELGVDEIITVVGYKKEDIISHYGGSYEGVSIKYAHQPKQKGIAHALACVESAIDDDFMLMMGDVLFDGCIEDTVTAYNTKGTDGVALVKEVDDESAKRYEVCDLEGGNIQGFSHKPSDPPSNKILTGFYILPPEILDYCKNVSPSERGEYDLTDAIQQSVTDGFNISPVLFDGWMKDIGRPEDKKEAEQHSTPKKKATPFLDD